VRVKR